MKGSDLAKVLKNIASAVEKLDDLQLDVFLKNLKRKEIFQLADVPAVAPRGKRKHAKVDSVELEGILQKLESFSSRDDGMTLLEGARLTRKELERMAKLRKVHVLKDDDVGRIREKLIETIIGSRLNSRAIRGG